MTTSLTFTSETLGYIAHFERMTNAKVRDCFFAHGKLVFIVETGPPLVLGYLAGV